MKALLIFYVFVTGDMMGVTKPYAFVSMDARLEAAPAMVAMLPERDEHLGPWQWLCVPVAEAESNPT